MTQRYTKIANRTVADKYVPSGMPRSRATSLPTGRSVANRVAG